MVSVTIPKNITKGEELVVIPKKLYEHFLSVLKRLNISTEGTKEIIKLSSSAKSHYKKMKEDFRTKQNVFYAEDIDNFIDQLQSP